MKKIIIAYFAMFTNCLLSQQIELISQQNYEYKKLNGLLYPNINYQISSSSNVAKVNKKNPHAFKTATTNTITPCGCLLPVDNTYSVVPFNSGFAPDYRCDDGSAQIPLPFNFNFYGTNYNSLYINNNGNVSFGNSYSTFSSDSFPNSNFVMIAPFWGDVDTRDTLSGLVYYKITPTSIIIKWDSVGYFNLNANLRNTFQLILTNGLDTILSNGNNVAFCYGDMQWTTGTASGGTNGFGGIPATVGVNKGDAINFFQVGRFDATGSAFDGPYNNNDGVSFLDNQSIYFNTTNPTNIPPIIINNNLCDSIDVFTGDTLMFYSTTDTAFISMTLLAGENTQSVTASFTSDAGTAHFFYTQQIIHPEYQKFNLKFFNGTLPAAYYHIYVNTIDNGLPALSSNRVIVIKNNASLSVSNVQENYLQPISISPNPSTDLITITTELYKNRKGTITNTLGEVVLEFELHNKSNSIDVFNLDKGLYFITISGSKVLKIMKE